MRHSNSTIKYLYFFTLVTTGVLFLPFNAGALDLQQAEKLAVRADPVIEGFRAKSRSHTETSVADSSLPDPQLRLGAANVPVDTFDLEQEQMTQLKLGIMQHFPRGDSLTIKQKQSRYLSESAQAKADDETLKVIRDVRENYLNLFYELAARRIILETRKLFSELLKITESSYAAGRADQQDVVLADLELSRLDDRATKIKASEESYRARLGQWIGDAAWYDISTEFPRLPELPETVDLNHVISQHPLIRAESANIEASKQQSEIARQEYRPGWSLVVDYGYRSGDNPDGSDRADFATAMVSMDVPLFTGKRQDKKLASSEQNVAAARYEKDDRLRQLKAQYETNRHLWLRLGEREQLYKNSLLTAAKNNARVSLKAYQSGVSEFNTLMRAQITELDMRLENLRVRVDRSIAQAKILYVIGGADTGSVDLAGVTVAGGNDDEI